MAEKRAKRAENGGERRRRMATAEGPREYWRFYSDPTKKIEVGDELWDEHGNIFICQEYDPLSGKIRLEATGRTKPLGDLRGWGKPN